MTAPASLPRATASAGLAIAGGLAAPGAPVYRRFFLAAIATTLTAGAGWGAVLLLRIAGARSFTALSVFEVNAHGQAQIYGWVGLFILGFAYWALPRFKGVAPAMQRLAALSFYLMVAGVVVRSFAEPLHGLSPWWRGLALAAGGAELAAVACFFAVVAATLYRAPGGPAIADLYVLAAAGWFVAGAGFDLVHLQRTMAAASREALLAQVATYQFALRDIQIHGLATMMIFGMSLRLAPALFGARPARPRVAAVLWLPMQLAVAAEVVTFVAFMRTREVAWAAGMGVAMLALAAAATLFVLNLNLFLPIARPDRGLKYLRVAHLWLVVSLAMLLAGPLYARLAGIPFSHAWYGATRHAITVGFVTLTIMGVAARAVPAFQGLDGRWLPALWIPFVLVNLGCTLRVVLQVATDLVPETFPAVGVSGVLELAGLALWGAHLARLLLAGRGAGAMPSNALAT